MEINITILYQKEDNNYLLKICSNTELFHLFFDSKDKAFEFVNKFLKKELNNDNTPR